MVATRAGKEAKAASASADSSSQVQEHALQGNLGSLLTLHEHAQNSNNTETNNSNQPPSTQQHTQEAQAPLNDAPLTINIPPGVHEGSVREEDRDRSLTMGSEFDQIFAHIGKDGRGMSIGGLLTPLGDAMSEGTSTTAVSGSTSSTANSAVMHHSQAAAQSHLPRLPEHARSSGSMPMDTTPITSNNTSVPSRAIPVGARGRGESLGSASMFLNGIYNTSNSQQQLKQQPISHTPPSYLGTSYENSHFGKRMRAGVSSY